MSQPSTIVVNGKTYQYDYESDIYYCTHNQTPESNFQRWRNIVIALVLLGLIFLFAHFFLHT
jgi:hypothetical protein